MNLKNHLITFHTYRDASLEFDKYRQTQPFDKAKVSHLDIYYKDRRLMFRVVNTLEDAMKVGRGMWFVSVKFNGMIHPDAREFLLSRINGVK